MRWFRHPGRVLDAYLDGELHPTEAAEVAEHLEVCRACRNRAEITTRVRRTLRTVMERIAR